MVIQKSTQYLEAFFKVVFNSDRLSCWANKSLRVEIQICEGDTPIVPIKFIDLMSV